MTNRKFLIVSASLLVMGAFSMNAQVAESNNSGKKEYSTNWYMGVSGGIDAFHSIGSPVSNPFSFSKGNGFDAKIKPQGELFFGRWYTPKFGTRFGLQGMQLAPKKMDPETVSLYNSGYLHGDLMWGATSWLTPYAHAGILSAWNKNEAGWANQNEVVAGFGAILSANLSDNVALFADIRHSLLPERVANVPHSRFSSIESMSLGLRYNFEKDGEIVKSFARTYAKPSDTRITQNMWDDMFIMGGAGINTLNSFNGYGFDGRITPAFELAVGKWLTNDFGLKLALQGLSFSHWGQEPNKPVDLGTGMFHDQMLHKERINFQGANLSFLWDLNSTINGYNPERTWTFIPYLHGGYLLGYSPLDSHKILNNEWAGGAGLLNTIRVNDDLSVYIDAKAWALNHAFTEDDKDGYTAAGTLTAGIYYDLGRQYVRYHGSDMYPAERQRGNRGGQGVSGAAGAAGSRYSEYATNWFIGGGIGANTLYSLGSGNGLDTKLKPAGELFIGKWYTPRIGVRFGVQGGQYAPKKLNPETIDLYNGIYSHGDLLWSATKWLTPYAHAGIVSVWQKNELGWANQNEVVAGFGAILSANITDNVAIYADLRNTILPQRFSYIPDAKYSDITTAMVGLRYSFDRNGEDTGSFVGRFTTPSTTRLAETFTDDTFVMGGAGINTLNSFKSYGWNGRITPAVELSLGKWLTNTFGLRLGLQGVSFSHWGEKPYEGTSLGQGVHNGESLYKERIGANYAHFDMLWDLTSVLGGYNPDRTWSVVPYLHAGVLNGYQNIDAFKSLNYEWAGGAGITNLFKVSDKASIYVDPRFFLLNHAFTLDDKDGYTAAASLTAGVYYDLGRQRVRFHQGEILGPSKSLDFLWPSNDEHYGPYIYNGILDNWFIGGSFGIATLANKSVGAGFNGQLANNFDAYIGKWFSPSFGLRAGYMGSELKFWGNRPELNTYVADKFDGKDMFSETLRYGYTHGDLMWNILNTTSGYKENRLVEVIPYASAGLWSILDGDGKIERNEFAAGAGLLNAIALNDRLKFNVDLRATRILGRATGDLQGGKAYALSAMGGLSIDLGKNYWGPGQGILLNEMWDNWFVQSSAGVTTATSDLKGVVFTGRMTPSEEIMIGKWFSPSVGIRAGVQGVALSQWGSAAGDRVKVMTSRIYGKTLDIEKFKMTYNHADIMWNVLNTFNYNEDRTFDVIPYTHFGIYKQYTDNASKNQFIKDEYGLGAGLIVSKDLDRKVSLYADMRGTALKKAIVEDSNAKNTYGLTASLGLTYNLGGGNDSMNDRKAWKHLPYENFETEVPARRWAASINLIDLADYGTANIEIQRVLARHITTDMTGKFNLWRFNEGAQRDQRQTLSLGARYWPWYTYSGLWVKAFGQVEEYATSGLKKAFTIGRNSTPEKGSAYGAGLGFGYSLMVKKNLNIDFGVSGWAGNRDYFQYTNSNFNEAKVHGSEWFIAPADMTLSVMFVF